MPGIRRFLWLWAAATLALWLADLMFSSMAFDGAASLGAAGLLLALVNLTLKPLLMLLALPLVLVSFGLLVPILNGLLLWLIAWLIPGFSLSGFWMGVLAALVVSVFTFLVNLATGQARMDAEFRRFHLGTGQGFRPSAKDKGEVIDVDAREKSPSGKDRDRLDL